MTRTRQVMTSLDPGIVFLITCALAFTALAIIFGGLT